MNRFSYRLLAELISFITENVSKTNDVNELIEWLRDNEGYISNVGGRK